MQNPLSVEFLKFVDFIPKKSTGRITINYYELKLCPLCENIGAAQGWIAIPIMNVNPDTVNRLSVPIEMQGRVFESFATVRESGSVFVNLFGSEKIHR